MKSQE